MILLQVRHVAAYAVVLIMASQFSLENRPPFTGFLVISYLPEPVVHLLALHTELLLTGFTKEDELILSILAAVMGESKEVKGIGSAVLFCLLSLVQIYQN